MKNRLRVVSLFLVLVLMTCIMSGCAKAQAKGTTDLMADIMFNDVDGLPIDDEFKDSYMSFSAELLKRTYNYSNSSNTVISPISAQSVIAMLMNGADGETLAEMERVLGISRDDLNEYMYTFMSEQNFDTFNSANSIWFRNDKNSFEPNKDYLQKSADYYNAQIFASKFDDDAVDNVNKWVSDKTDGMIDGIIDKFDYNEVMLLINAVLFDSEWQTKYTNNQVGTMEFTSLDGTKRDVATLSSGEKYYIKTDSGEVGIRKLYKDTKYSFAAFMPEEGTDFNTYINNLDGQKLSNIINSTYRRYVITKLPKFKIETEVNLKGILSDMGMPLIFVEGAADLSGMGESPFGDLYVSRFRQDAVIELDERGTKAAAVTHSVDSSTIGISEPDPVVHFNRPFIYMIIDNDTNVPVFIGTVTNL